MHNKSQGNVKCWSKGLDFMHGDYYTIELYCGFIHSRVYGSCEMQTLTSKYTYPEPVNYPVTGVILGSMATAMLYWKTPSHACLSTST